MAFIISMQLPTDRSASSKSPMHLSIYSVLKTNMILPSLLLLLVTTRVCAERETAYFNSSSLITIPNTIWDFNVTKEVTFRTCSDSGNLISMNGSLISPSLSSMPLSNSQHLAVQLHNSSIVFSWSIPEQNGSVQIGNNNNNNKWYTVKLKFLLNSLQFIVLQGSDITGSVVVANKTNNSDLLNLRLSGTLKIGDGFSGCLYQGPGLNFTSTGFVTTNIIWDTCPLTTSRGCSKDQLTDACFTVPCQHGATCKEGATNYTCLCPHNFNGTHCENDLAAMYGCDVQPCMNQGTCQPLSGENPHGFRCHCAEGYTGETCETTIDQCHRNPCEQGTCINGVGSFRCDCTGTGFEGENCTVDINECNNATICGNNPCSNRPGGFSCVCPPGYDGVSCKEVDECTSSPCENGGTCTDGPNTFTCACMPGYTGVMCEENINDCLNNPCTLPNMTCVDGVNHYDCTCIEGFSGSPCRDTDECALNVCRNNATCTNSQGSYTCHCLPGFTGKNCGSVLHFCQPNHCQNNATCSASVNGYNCSCLAGYNGTNCEINIDDCKAHQCKNQARCEDQVNGYKCVCQPGWTGQYCQEDINECDSNPCLNGGHCHNLQNSFNCTCQPGFNGSNCGVNPDDCTDIHCENGGVCLDGANDYTCNCTSEWMGKNCTEVYNACTLKPCLNNASCNTDPPQHNYTCTCLPGFTESKCEVNIDDCVGHTCLDYQQCYDGIGNYSCGCPRGYTGDNCMTEIDVCESNPCQNGGNCTRGHGGNYTCSCVQSYLDLTALVGPGGMFLTGYNGTNCEKDINECDYHDPPICQGGGKCDNVPTGGFTCFCRNVPGQLGIGIVCEESLSYCDIQQPGKFCQHGGTCVNLFVGSKCNCVAGFNGSYCEHDINECESNPCQHNGSCSDRVNGYVCTCIDGINGTNCENNIDDCSPNPCQHGGSCLDRINNFTCNCSDTGFNGTTCEVNIDDCVNSDCRNGGTCVDVVKNYTCSCPLGYTSSRCEVDIPDCSPNPCAYSSQCLEYSNTLLYDKGDSRFVNFTYEKAAGYLCICVTGLNGLCSVVCHCSLNDQLPYKHVKTQCNVVCQIGLSCVSNAGTNCTEDINECLSGPCQHNSTCNNIYKDGFNCSCSRGYDGHVCEHEINECTVFTPCKNGGTCRDKVADYDCTCPAPVASRMNFGGKNCSVFLRGCEGPRRCWNGNCIPKLINESLDLHSFDCDCYPGYTGQYCAQSTDISFRSNHNDYIKSQLNSSDFNLSLRFQTTVSTGVLVLWKMSATAFVSVELSSGKVLLRYKNDFGINSCLLRTLAPVNNSAYHLLRLVVSQNITLSLPLDNCTSEGCSQGCRTSFSIGGSQSPVSSQLYIGNGAVAEVIDPELPAGFVGCMEDVMINGQLYYPGRQNGQYFVSPGCSRVPQCVKDSCSGHGFCEDLWDSSVCHCYRPYYGDKCENEYESATFGIYEGTYATYSVYGNADDWLLSFFIITKQQDGFILYMGNEDHNYAKKRTFIGLYLRGGNLSGDFFKCGQTRPFNTGQQISDGQKHFITMEVKNTFFKVTEDSRQIYNDSRVPMSSSVCSPAYGFAVTLVNIGRGVSPSTRRKRYVDSSEANYFGRIPVMNLRRWRRQAPTVPTLLTSYQNMSGFQGIIQDVQVNNFKLSYNNTNFTTPRAYNVTAGEYSTITVCHSSLCENAGTCREAFYNDFKCECPRGFMGKNCSMLDFCAYETCPSESTCQNLALGYECNSTASFITDNSIVTYTVSGTTPQPVLTFQFRTRGLFGLIFLLRKGDYFFKVRVANGRLEMNWKLSSDFSTTSVTRSGRRVDDGQWYRGRFEVINGTQIKLQVLQDAVLLDETAVVNLAAGSFNFEEMLRDGEIILGSSGRQKFSTQWEAGFKGCLREVRIGGRLLPFFRDETFKNNDAINKFLVQRVESVVNNCNGANSCGGHSCLNGGSCIDLWNDYKCECPAGLEGQLCEENPDNCASDPCLNGGICADGLATFTCACPRGYSGSLCESRLEPCATNSSPQCANGSICVEYGSDYKCNCSDLEQTGWYCNVSIHQNCSSSGNLCQNGGTCHNTVLTMGTNTNVSSFNCSCMPGYEGPLCEKPIDYCSLNGSLCLNGGDCIYNPDNHTYQCVCNKTLGYEGQNCSVKIDPCHDVSCGNGTCVTGTTDFACSCNWGYTGPKCESRIDECENRSLCQHGNCSSGFCNCTRSGWAGDQCTVEVDECNYIPTCQNGGHCTNTEGSFFCNCTLGYTGPNCETPNCTNICQKGGTCQSNETHWHCDCPEFVRGVQCEEEGPCFRQPCQKNNTHACTQSADFNNYTCSCKQGWRGTNCTEDVDECTEMTAGCVNGNCVNTIGSYTCDCKPGFTGLFCDVDINECLPKPCENGGVCVDGVGNYTCKCDGTGYNGTNCSTNIDECAANASLCNQGTCKDTPGSYECHCPDQYQGRHCEIENPCYNSTLCHNDGKCQSNLTQNGSYVTSCVCLTGYDGTMCEKSYSTGSKSPDLGVIIGPIVGGVVLVILIIVLIAFIMTARSKRATRGAYSPSQQETSGSRVELDNVLKKPPEERLI